jgi:hypothetical protein
MSAVALREAPSGLVPLSEVLADMPPGQQAAAGFNAWVQGRFADGSEGGGRRFPVTAVLGRTAVLQVGEDDRRLARHDALLVEAGSVVWEEAPPPPGFVLRSPRRRPRDESDPVGEEMGDQLRVESQSVAAVADVEVTEGGEPTASQGAEPVSLAVADDHQAEAGGEPRRCGGCDVQLPQHNRRGMCVPCQRTCPPCGGPKSIPAPRCRRCGHGREAEVVQLESQSVVAVAEVEVTEADEPTPSHEADGSSPLEEADDPQAEVGGEPRRCGGCDVQLPRNNRRGMCVACQRICPTCRGPKSIPAAQCRRCEHGREAELVELETSAALSVADQALVDLPARVQELLDHVVALAQYARSLEDEVQRHRTSEHEMERLRRRLESQLAAGRER